MKKTILLLIIILCGCQSKNDLNDTSKHNGNWMWHIKNNEQEGQWVQIADTGSFSIDNGKSIWWHDNGIKREEGTKTNGKKTGHWIAWYENGKIMHDLFYRNDTVYQHAWYDNGKKELQGALYNNKGAGQWYTWFDNGQLHKDVFYRNDTAYQKQWYNNGKLHGIGKYYKNDPIGKIERWYDNGNRMDIANWNNGLQHGSATIYYENGKIKIESTWDNGIAIGNWKFYNQDQKLDSIIKYPEMVRIK